MIRGAIKIAARPRQDDKGSLPRITITTLAATVSLPLTEAPFPTNGSVELSVAFEGSRRFRPEDSQSFNQAPTSDNYEAVVSLLDEVSVRAESSGSGDEPDSETAHGSSSSKADNVDPQPGTLGTNQTSGVGTKFPTEQDVVYEVARLATQLRIVQFGEKSTEAQRAPISAFLDLADLESPMENSKALLNSVIEVKKVFVSEKNRSLKNFVIGVCETLIEQLPSCE